MLSGHHEDEEENKPEHDNHRDILPDKDQEAPDILSFSAYCEASILDLFVVNVVQLINHRTERDIHQR